MQFVKNSELSVYQPAHWIAEAAAVVSRLSPHTAIDDITDLCDLGFEVLENRDVYLTAFELSSQLNHHLFDTLYHAVALSLPDTILITADERYFNKAKSFGHIISLQDIDRLFANTE